MNYNDMIEALKCLLNNKRRPGRPTTEAKLAHYYDKKECKKIVDQLFMVIKNSLASGDVVRIARFGEFIPYQRRSVKFSDRGCCIAKNKSYTTPKHIFRFRRYPNIELSKFNYSDQDLIRSLNEQQAAGEEHAS